MSEYLFGVAKGAHLNRMSDETKARLDAIAAQHDAWRVGQVSIPGDGLKMWFATKNLGHPFDRATERAVKADILADEDLVEALGVDALW